MWCAPGIWAGRRDQAPPTGRRTAAFLSVLADRVNGFAVLIVVACVATLCCPTPLPSWILGTVAGMGAACLLGLARLAAVALAAQNDCRRIRV